MEITEIKQRLTVAQVLARYGLKPDKHLRLCCPFHEDAVLSSITSSPDIFPMKLSVWVQ
jgi:hypothetical protein